jgi:hypothetical protein
MSMDEHVEKSPDGPPQDSPGKPVETTSRAGPPPARNRGWFQKRDHRINREGRPRGSKAAEGGADRAPRADRLMLLVLPERDLASHLRGEKAPRIANLPADCEIVSSRRDAARGVVVLRIRSKDFPRIAKGAPIPEFKPAFSEEQANRAPSADRLMLLVLRGRDVAWRLTRQNAPWIVNLPADFEIVACRVDAALDAVTFAIRSTGFPLIAKGAVIPQFRPDFNGLRWRRG